MKQGGFSLVEMLIYVGLLTVIFIVVVSTVISFTTSYQTISAYRVIDNSSVPALERMTRDIRAATSIDTTNSVFGTSTGALSIIQTTNGISTTTKFYLYNNSVQVDVNNASTGPLTLSAADISSLIFNELVSSTSDAVKIDMTIQARQATTTETKNFHTTIIVGGQ